MKKKTNDATSAVRSIIKDLISFNKWKIHDKMYSMGKKRTQSIVELDERAMAIIIKDIVKEIKSDIINEVLPVASKTIKNEAIKRLKAIKRQENRKAQRLALAKRYEEQRKERIEDAKKKEAHKLILKETLTKEQIKELNFIYTLDL